MSRRYLAALAVAAALVLSVGVFVRARLRHDDRPPPAAPPSQAAVLQQLSQEGELRRMSAFFAERVAAVAGFVEYLPAVGAAGVRWAGDTIVSTGPAEVVTPVRRPPDVPPSDSLRRPVTLAADTVRRDWLLVVGRDALGGVISTAGLSGGRTRADCAGRPVETYVLGAPLDRALAGAGVFNLDGEALGLVVRCGERVAAIPAREVTRLLAAGGLEPDPARTPLGLAVTSLDGPGRGALAAAANDSGLFVTAVRRGGAADVAGLRVGDVLLAVGGRPATADVARALVGPRSPADTVAVLRRRGRATATVRIVARADSAPAPAGVGLTFTPPAARGVPVTAVRPGSAAAAAGLRPGDRLLRVGEAPVTAPAAAERLLAAAGAATGAAAGASPTLLVFERDSVERGVLVPRQVMAPRPSASPGAPR